MRNIKQLLEIMLDNQQEFTHGLCSWSGNLRYEHIISHSEFLLLKKYINENRPNKWSSLSAFVNSNSVFYWEKGDIKPRIEWIKKHIKLNS
jgi:hypothetical protein